MNKKAQFGIARKAIYWTMTAVIITAIIFAFALTVAKYKNNLTRVPIEIKAEFISLRFTNIPECFAYQNSETNLVFPGTIDLEKFTNEQFLNCYNAGPSNLRMLDFRLKLQDLDKEVKTAKYGNLVEDTIFKEVLVKKDEELVKDQLIIYIQK